ncbi:MAG: LacI family DNA-binding transcriptional regulator [Chloroflexota bacterium]
MVSIKDVAKHAGVSVTTVSLVLNNKGNISQDTRRRVLNAVERLGYTRSIRARNLRDQQSRIIGYAQASDRGEFNPLLDHFLYDLVHLVEASDRHLILFKTSSQRSLDPYRELIKSQRVDGFILSYTEAGDSRFRYLYEKEMPFVAFGRSLTEYDEMAHWVDVDGEHGLYLSAMHLIDQGHENIAFLGWPEGSASGDMRFAGFLRALEERGIPFRSELVARTENYVHNGFASMAELMQCMPKPTAVAAVSDALAIGAIQYLHQIGVRLAVTGFDDTPTAAYMSPPLTTVRQPIDEVSALLVEMLIDQLEGRAVQEMNHVLKPELIIRKSSTLDY